MSDVTVNSEPSKTSPPDSDSPPSERVPATLQGDAAQAARGICMGAADVVPGVSGGTVALILGIYERLVTALSHVDGQFFGHLRARRWSAAAQHLDLRFLVALGAGVFVGFLAMTLTINVLLSSPQTRVVTLAVFFGTIVASSILIGFTIRPRDNHQLAVCVLLGLAGAGFAFWLATLRTHDPSAPADPSYLFLFLSGSIAICAMILPGISGAMILLLLGVYVYLTDIPHALLHGEDVVRHLATIAVFGSGALLSLICFSKVLRWLLVKHHAQTMALLAGFMIGALPKIWPFQRDLTPAIEKVKYKTFESYWPTTLDSQMISAIVAAAIAALLVFAVHRFTNRPHASVDARSAS